MNNEEAIRLIIEVNNILAEWDPTRSHIIDDRWPHSEYISYILPIISAYRSAEEINTYDLLIRIFYRTYEDKPDEEQDIAIKETDIKLKSLFNSFYTSL